jgi:hypothetical protein
MDKLIKATSDNKNMSGWIKLVKSCQEGKSIQNLTPKVSIQKLLRPPNTDNKGKLLVTVFAFCSCTHDSFVAGDKPGPLRCTA